MVKKLAVVAFGIVLLAGLLGGCFLLPNRPPEAMFVVRYDVDPADPLVVDLDASSSSDPDGDAIVAYAWIFGDDVTFLAPLEYTATVQTPVLRVRYQFEDTYSLTLVVHDERGASSSPFPKTISLPYVHVAPMR